MVTPTGGGRGGSDEGAPVGGDGTARGSGVRGPEENARERVNRQWQEILQETRVAQTGVQILFGFLLSVAFTARFTQLGPFDRTIYVVTVILAAGATGALIAPVSLHRFLSGRRMKNEVVEAAGRLMMCGMVLLALTVGSTLLLILHVVLSDAVAEILVGAVMVWFLCSWYILPVFLRRRSASGTDGGTTHNDDDR